MIEAPKPRRRGNEYWIPPFIPHWDDWVGPYSSLQEAESDREGMQITINSVEWQDMLLDQEEEFEEEWERRLLED